MSNLIDEVIEIKNNYTNLLDTFEKNIGINNILNLFKTINSTFAQKSHGREWREFRKIYRADFPILNKNVNELVNLFDVYYTAFINECLNACQKLYSGKVISDMKSEALHIQAWDVALCSINKKVIGGVDDCLSNIEIQFYDLLQKYNLSKLEITKQLSSILTVLPVPLMSYEDMLSFEYKKFFKDYHVTTNSYFKLSDIDYKKYKYILRASLYNEQLFNNQISLINSTNGNYFSNYINIEKRQKQRNDKILKLKTLITNKDDLNYFKTLLSNHDALTYLNVNIESQFGFKSIIGLIGIYIIKEQV